MKQNYTVWLGVLLLFLQLPVLAQDNLAVQYRDGNAVPDFLNICGDPDDVAVTVRVEGIELAERRNILATLRLFKGTQFVSLDQQNSSAGVMLIDASDLSNPVFSLPNLSPTALQNVTIAYSIAANCQVIDTLVANDETMVLDSWELNYNLGDETDLTEIENTAEYRDAFAIPTFTLAIENTTDAARVGDCYTRNIIVNNSALDGFVNGLTYENQQERGVSIQEIAVNGQAAAFTKSVDNQGDTTIQLDITGALFVNNLTGNGDNFFDPDERLVITETYCVTSCEAGRQSVHSVSWGCYDRTCQTVSDNDFVPIGEGTANVRIAKEGSFPDLNPGYCTTGQTTVTFANQGVEIDAGFAAMTDLQVGIGLGSGFQLAAEGYFITGFRIGNTNLSSSTPIIVINNNPLFATDPDGNGGLSDMDGDGFFDDLDAGESLELTAFYEFDCTQATVNDGENCTNDFAVAFNARVDYTNQCKERLLRLQPNFFRPANNNSGFENTATPDADVEEDIFFVTHRESRTIRNFTIDCDNQETFIATVALPQGVTPVIEQTTLIKNDFTPVTLLNSEVQNGNLILTYDANSLNFLLGDYELKMAFTADCTAQSGATTFPFTFELSCPSCDCRHLWFCDDLNGPILHVTNPPCDNVAACDDGIQTTDFRVNRTTFGFTDNTYTQRFKPENANQSVAIACDSVEMRVTNTVGNASLNNNIGVVISYDNIDAENAAQTFLFSNGTVAFTQNGQVFECAVSPADLTVTPTANGHELNFDLSRCLQQSGLTLTQNDEVNFIGNFYVNPDGAYTTQFRNVPNLRGYGYAINNGETIICDSYGDSFTLAKTNTVFDFPNTNFFPQGCEIEPLQYRLITINNGFREFFGDELRRAVVVDSLVFNYDPNILAAFENIELEASIPDHPIHGDDFFPLPSLSSQTLGNYVAKFDTLLTASPYNNVSAYAFNVRLKVTPTCRSEFGSSDGDNRYRFDPTIYYRDRFYAASLGNGECAPEIVDAREDEILYENPPQFSLTPFGVTNYQLIGDTAVWTVQHCNTSFESDANTTFIAVEDTTGTIEVVSFEDVSDPNNPVLLTAQTYNGTGNNFFANTPTLLKADGQNSLPEICNTIRIKALVKRCDATTFKVKTGWNCAEFPFDWTPLVYPPCDEKELELSVTPLEPFLAANIIEQPSENPAICDEGDITILVRNTNLGTAFNVRTRLTFPPNGATLVPGSVEFAYPSDSAFQAVTTDPVLVADNAAGKIYEYTDFSFLNEQLAQQGLPGFNPGSPGAMNEFRLRYRFRTDCGFESGDLLFYNFQGVKGCGERTNFEAGETRPIVIQGTEGDFSKLLEVAFSPQSGLQPNGISALQIDVTNRTVVPTDATDMLVLVLPQLVTYVSNSSSQNFGEPTITLDSDGRQELTWDLPLNLQQNETASVNFAVNAPNIECGVTDNVQVILKTVSTEELICERDNSPCTVQTVTSTTGEELIDLPANRAALQFTINDFSAICLTGNQEEATIDGTLTSTGENLAGTTLDLVYHFDENGNGIYDLGEIEVRRFTENNALPLNFNHVIQLNINQLCGLVLRLDTDGQNDVCGVAEVDLGVSPLQNAGENQSVCPLELTTVELGIGQAECADNSGYTYEWQAIAPATLNNFSDISVPNPTVTISHDGQSVENLAYVLATTRGNCGTSLDTIQITLGIGIEITRPATIEIEAGENITLQPELTGGTPPLTYQWDPDASLSATDIPNPVAMPNENTQYRLTVTDANGCTAEAIFPVTIRTCQPPVVTSVNTTTSTCGNAEGTATILLDQPTNNYTFKWSPEAGQPFDNGAQRSNLPFGGYRVQITQIDDETCTTEAAVLVQNADGPQATATVQPSSCQSNTGRATLEPAEFTYFWEDNVSANERTDLAAGIYFVTFTDPADPDCPNALQLEIEDENVLQADVTVNQQPDCGQANGSAALNITGGSGDYNYSWEGGTATRVNLPSGIYQLTVTDNQSASCSVPVSFVLTDDVTPAIISSTGTTNVTCNGDMDGSIEFEINYSENFAFPADTIFSNGNQNFNNGELPAGQICIVIEDANDCVTGGFCFEIREPAALRVDLNATESCQNDGSIDGQISGGTAPYVINWQDLTDSDNDLNRNDLAAGNYALTVTDANGCMTESRVEVPDCQCTPPDVTSVQTTPVMCEMSNGSVTLQIANPDRYVFTWQPELGTSNEAGNVRTGLPLGGYQIRVADRADLACNVVVSALVQSDTDLDVTKMITPATCESDNGMAVLEPADFTYEWSDGGTGNGRMNLAEGTYFVTITDPANPNCPQVEEVIIQQDNPLEADITVNQQPDCEQANGSVTLNVTGGSGDYTYSWGSDTNTQDGLAAGVYTVTITDNSDSGCELPFIFILTDNVPAATVNVLNIMNVTCPGGNDGRLDFTVDFSENFTEPADAFITNGIRQVVNGSLIAGSYCLQINDGNDCVAGGFCFTIEEPDPLELDLQLTQPCEAAGEIAVNVTGGTAPYTFNWADLAGEDNPANRADVNVGDYNLTITDANGCFLIEDNIRLDTCQVCDIFPTDFDFVQTTDCAGTTKFCFDLQAADVPNYEVTVDGEPYEQGFGRCSFDTLGIYSFITLLNSVGPYDLNSWTINGEQLSSTFQTIPDLVDTMNMLDPRGDWELSEDGLLATGGFSGNVYGALNISNQDGVQASIGYNTGFSPQGYFIDLQLGTHDLIFTNTATGCMESIRVDVVCLQTDTIRIEIEEDEMRELCFDGDELTGAIDTIFNACPIDNATVTFADSCATFTGMEAGTETACIVVCDENQVCDTTIVIVTVQNVGIIDTIVVGQKNEYCFENGFGSLEGELATIQNVCPELSGQFVDFTVNEETFCVEYEGLDIGTNNACIEVCDTEGICDSLEFTVTVVEGNVIYDTIYVNNGGGFVCLGDNVPGSITGIEDRCADSNGTNVDFQINLVTNCVTYDPVSVGTDTACIVITDNLGNEHRTNIFITVKEITPEFINDTIFISQTKIYCADTTQLPGRINFIDNFCPEESGEFVDFFLDPNEMCVEYTGLEIGQDSACIVFCDVNGLCDTAFITVTVVEFFDPPTANNDTARTTRGTPVVIDVKENDVIFGGIDTAYILTPPLYGEARFNLDCSVTYEPNEQFCDRSDEFEYVICNPNGCDTARVEVFIDCVGIFIFNAVSPNGDGFNDVFFIAGLDDKPENNLQIFNRWGNLVYEADNYQNTWDGNWDTDKELPDGTYFYILTVNDNGEDLVFRGYLELFR